MTPRTFARRATTRVAALVTLVAALSGMAASCSGSSSDTNGAGTDGGVEGGPACADAYACTIDVRTANGCEHFIGPVSGATACPAGQYCTVERGCVAAPACAADADCAEVWAGDACKASPRCDPASALCLFDVLDRDGDGHPPQVCGGADCDDSNQDLNPDETEQCDGADQNCNGLVDDAAVCETAGAVCVQGVCGCEGSLTDCGGACVDLATDPSNCGNCGRDCGEGVGCADHSCQCPVDRPLACSPCMAPDYSNCGYCGRRCPLGSTTCEVSAEYPGGRCTGCDPSSQCDGECVDLQTDKSNCGACGNRCAANGACVAGQCECRSCTCRDTGGQVRPCELCSCSASSPTCTPHCGCPYTHECTADGTWDMIF